PRTPAELLLSQIWQEVLGVERVGIKSNFFELGGHSLLATQVVSRVRSSLKIEVSLRTLFQAPTVEGLAAAIDEINATPSEFKEVAIKSISREARRVSLSALSGKGGVR